MPGIVPRAIDQTERRETVHARVVTGTFQPAKLDEAIKFDHDSLLPAVKKQKGFKGYYALIDRKTGKAMAISLWDTEADMTASLGPARGLLAKLIPFVTGQPTVDHYEVSVQG